MGHYAFGIDSAIGSSFNFAPQLYLQINEALANNDVAKAKKLQKTVTELYAALFKHGTSKMIVEICGEIQTDLMWVAWVLFAVLLRPITDIGW